ncbi:MAG: HD-GYP domain-containing protein [Clostridiales bacterium]|nr:HD-GYP domain-containing protein [Clostridiales bacterium]
MNSNLRFWLYFSLFLPILAMTVFSILLFNKLDVITSVTPIYYYILMVMSAIIYIGISLFVFNSIQKSLKANSKKIYDWSNKIKAGDLTERLSFSKKSDLYYIAASYNTMADIMENLIIENTKKISALEASNDELKELNNNLVSSLVSAIEAKDKYTLGHSERVSQYAVDIATKLNLPQNQINEIKIAGMLHDVGKIGISDEILHKPAKLSKAEFEEMKRHPSIGTWILNTLNLSENTINAINYHHERYDGTGYPLGIPGKDLPIETQIISLSDAYDAMTSERPYRDAMSPEEAIKEIKKNADTQFNPQLVEILEENILAIKQ